MVDVLELERSHRAIGIAGHEHEVEDPDDTSVDQVEKSGKSLAPHFVAGELDDQVTDWAQGPRFVWCHVATFRLGGRSANGTYSTARAGVTAHLTRSQL